MADGDLSRYRIMASYILTLCSILYTHLPLLVINDPSLLFLVHGVLSPGHTILVPPTPYPMCCRNTNIPPLQTLPVLSPPPRAWPHPSPLGLLTRPLKQAQKFNPGLISSTGYGNPRRVPAYLGRYLGPGFESIARGGGGG